MTTPAAPASGHSEPVPFVAGLAEIASRYDGFMVDLWGTVHDGFTPLAGAVDCLERLKAADKRILMLSNAPRRNADVVARMRRIGIADELYDAVLSSGEAAYQALRARADPWHRALGRACLMLGAADDDSVVRGLELERAETPEAAEFIIAVGVGPGETLADHEAVLATAAGRRLPMICANPDLVVLRGAWREPCAGALAARYEGLGGEVFYHGKPHAPIYAAALARLGLDDRARVLAVGDSLRTDVAGARAAGLDSLFVTSGIYAEELGVRPFAAPEPARLAALYARSGQRPTAAAAAFRW